MPAQKNRGFLPKTNRSICRFLAVFVLNITLLVFAIIASSSTKNFVYADSNTLTSEADWDSGEFDGIENETLTGDLNLKSDGAWGPRVFTTPKVTLTAGSSMVSDGTYVYIMEGYGRYFAKYVESSDTWETLTSPLHSSHYGGDMVYLDGYIYASFGGYQKEFSRYDITNDTWTDMADLPDLIYRGSGLATDGTYIYATRGSNTTDFWKYDVSENTWTVAPSTPATIYYGATLEYHDGYLYTPRGYNRTNYYRYDISEESWSSMATAPFAFGGDGVGTVKGDYIYYPRNANTDDFARYDINDNSWDTLEDTPQTHRYAGAVYNAGDDYVYVFRGNGTYEFWKYDTANNEFLGLTDLPNTPGSGADLIYDSGYLYFIRGNNNTAFYRYNISTDAWDSMTSIPGNINDDTKGVVANGVLYAFRGSNTVSFYGYNISGNSWSTLADTPSTVRYGGSLVYPGSGDYIYGTRGNYNRGFWRYSISGNSWDDGAVADLPDDAEAAYGSRLVTDGTDFYYTSGARTGFIYKYDVSEDTWTHVTDLKFAPYWGTDMEYYNGKLYLTAGYYKQDFWEYDISGDSWRMLDPLGTYYNFQTGSYNGGSLVGDGSGTFYHIRGNNVRPMNSYTVSSNNYLSSGTWTSDPIDLTYVSSWGTLSTVTTTPGDSSVVVQTRSSADQNTWTSWETVTGGTIASTAQRYFQIRVILNASTDRSQAPTLHSLTYSYSGDGTNPTNPNSFSGSSQEIGGVSLTSGETYSHAGPYFSWSGDSDAGSGVAGFYVYFGTTVDADPETLGTYQTARDYVVTTPLSGGTYYLRIKTKDVAGNVSDAVNGFTYVYQGVAVSSTTMTTTANFDTGTLDDVSSSNDQLKLSGKAGFWQEERLSTTPGSMRMGSSAAYVSSSEKIYALRGNNNTAFYEYDIASDTWTSKAVTPESVYYGGSLVAGPAGYLYGCRGNNTTDFWRYDITNDEWSDAAAADAPVTLYRGTSMVYDGSRYIYLIRGNNDDAFLRYDTTENTWTSLTSVDFGAPSNQVNNLANYGADLTFDGDNTIYAIQGQTRTGFASYSILDDEWTVLDNLPHQTYYGSQIEYNATAGALYFLSGWNKPHLYKYDLSTAEWTQLEDGPSTFYYGTSMTSVDEDIYVIRGNNSTSFYKYDTELDSWMTPTRGLYGYQMRGSDYRSFYYGAEIVKGDGDNFYMVRGYYDSLFIKYDAATGSVTNLADVPAGFYVGGTLAYESTNNKIYATSSQYNRNLYVYDIATDTWTREVDDPPPTNPGSGTSMVYDGSRYMYRTRGDGSNYFYRFDTQGTAGNKWEQLANITGGVGYGSQLVYKSGYIYVMRGNNVNDNPLYRYDPSGDSWATLSPLTGYRIYNDGFLVDGGDDYLYACRGANTDECHKYSVSGDSWSTIADAPAQIYYGGSAAADGNGKMYMISGPGTNSYNNGLYTYVAQTDSTSFENSGSYSSATHDLTAVYRFANLAVTYNTATNAGVSIYTRVSDDASDWSSWTEVSEEKSLGTTYTYKINSQAKRYIQVKIEFTSSDGVYSASIDDYTINYYQDTTAPTNATSISSYSDSGMGTAITTDTWYSHTAPYFNWPTAEETSGATDTSTGSGVIGYYVYFGTNALADPESLGELVAVSNYTPSSLVSGNTYYLRIKAVDDAGNVSSTAWQPFIYKFDSTDPNAPTDVTADPSGYSAVDSFDFSWTAATDGESEISSYCYKTGAGSGAYSVDQCSVGTSVEDIPSYQSGNNTFYVRSQDAAGNYSDYATVSYYYSGTAPSAPQNLDVTPDTNTENSFEFSWSAPALYFGSEANLIYHYSINAMPTSSSTTETARNSLDAGPYATLPGENTFYIVAEDEAGNIDWDVYSSVAFTANTTAPGIPTQVDIADVSVKATESWKIAVSWEAPEDAGAGVASYKIMRSDDGGSSYSEVASTSGISYVDTGLEQLTYYYRVKACDNANNCGEVSSEVSQYPDGKFTVAAPLVAEPEVSSITTQRATIAWTTSRTCDSKIAYGTSSDDYLDEEIGSSEHVTAHSVQLTNLAPGTTYYYVAKWTDEDGNTGISDEGTFVTSDAPSAKEISAKDVSLTTATIEFTSTAATSAKIYYGETTAFGGFKEMNVSSSETTYTVPLIGLSDGTKYFYKVNLFDVEAAEYEGDTYSFETLPRPEINNVKITQIKGLAEPTILLTWTTNTSVSSIVTYYPEMFPGEVQNDVNVELTEGKHRAVLSGLRPQARYVILVSGKDIVGNEATSDNIAFATAQDTRPPIVYDLKIEGSILKTGESSDQSLAQLIVSWKTDEPSTSQVEYGEGSGSVYPQKTQEDVNFTNNHLVVISNLTPSKVYHLRVLSKDVADNTGKSVDSVVITPRATDSALDLVVTNLSEVFGFLGNIN